MSVIENLLGEHTEKDYAAFIMKPIFPRPLNELSDQGIDRVIKHFLEKDINHAITGQILSSLSYQRRAVFFVTKRHLNQICEKDPDAVKHQTINSKQYKQIMLFLKSFRYFEVVQEYTNKTGTVFAVKPELLADMFPDMSPEELVALVEKQKREVLESPIKTTGTKQLKAHSTKEPSEPKKDEANAEEQEPFPDSSVGSKNSPEKTERWNYYDLFSFAKVFDLDNSTAQKFARKYQDLPLTDAELQELVAAFNPNSLPDIPIAEEPVDDYEPECEQDFSDIDESDEDAEELEADDYNFDKEAIDLQQRREKFESIIRRIKERDKVS